MMRYKLLCPVLALLLLVAGCANHIVPVKPPPGYIYSKIRAPLSKEYDGATVGEKTGTAKTQYLMIPFFWLSFSWGEADLEKAAANGGITDVQYADYDYMSILSIYSEFTVRAQGN